jgi:acetyl-CoA carboxylase biotin carboxyl carrier protein
MTDGERLEAIRRLLGLADAYALSELVVEEDGIKITIRGSETAATGVGLEFPTVGSVLPLEVASEEENHLHAVASPMTGVFFRGASPDVPPFVEVGDRVEEGETIGLIEAMKVFSEIPADCSGRVVEILAASGKLLSQGDPLMLLDPEG